MQWNFPTGGSRHKFLQTYMQVKGYLGRDVDAAAPGGLIILAPTVEVVPGHAPTCNCDECCQLWEEGFGAKPGRLDLNAITRRFEALTAADTAALAQCRRLDQKSGQHTRSTSSCNTWIQIFVPGRETGLRQHLQFCRRVLREDSSSQLRYLSVG
jgi:hypothetical protein